MWRIRIFGARKIIEKIPWSFWRPKKPSGDVNFPMINSHQQPLPNWILGFVGIPLQKIHMDHST